MPKTPPDRSSDSAGSSASNARWILLVDDESSIRQLIETVLVSQGYPVKTADGASGAMALLKGEPTPPTLMITDVVMPKTDGLALARQLRTKFKQLRVVFISGRLDDSAWWPADLSGIRLLHKPFSNADLLSAVSEAWAESAQE
jgi:two-component system cell cycle sensor histidine kinase/response regulator CckA